MSDEDDYEPVPLATAESRMIVTKGRLDNLHAEIAALRERNRLLHEALRQEGIGWRDEQHRRCGRCRYEWHEYEPESHAPDCLAAPAKEEG